MGEYKPTRNPAWRPAQSYSARLASISHHFLGHGKSGGQRAEPEVIHRVPVLLALDPAHPHPGLQPEFLVDALSERLNLTEQENAGPRWEVYATERPREADPKGANLVLMLATASRTGVRLAYTRIKQLMQSRSVPVGILFTGATRIDLAHRCQQRLAEGALWFLNLSLIEFGHIAGPGPECNTALSQMVETIHDTGPSDIDNRGNKGT